MEKLSEEERKEVIQYGIEREKTIILSIFITLLLGYLYGIFYQSIIFLFAFALLRRFAGGYHADSKKRCYIISLIIISVSFFCIRQIQSINTLGIWVQTINLIVIICLSPVENSERKLEEDEKKKYGIRTKVIAICLYSLYCILYSLGNVYMLAPVAVACLVVGILLIAGHIKYGKARMLVGWFI